MPEARVERLLVVDASRISSLISRMIQFRLELQMLQIGKELISDGGLVEPKNELPGHTLRIARQEFQRLGRALREFTAALHQEADRLALEYLRAAEPLN